MTETRSWGLEEDEDTGEWIIHLITGKTVSAKFIAFKKDEAEMLISALEWQEAFEMGTVKTKQERNRKTKSTLTLGVEKDQ
jgi:hypothetical protein